MAQTSFVANVAAFRVTLDGTDLTARFAPRLISLTLTEKRGDEADQLDVVIDDSDGLMAIPRAGARLSVALGWTSGSQVTPGLVDKGSFVVDEVTHDGPPDRITIRARAADFTSAGRARREQSWRATTLGAIVTEIAKRQALEPHVAPALASIPVPYLAQSREGDLALLKRLGREHDAVATIKAGRLIFAAIGAGVTASGRTIPTATFRRRDGDQHSYTVEKRDEASGVTVDWHDRASARKQSVTAGNAGKTRKLARVYASEDAAQKAAAAELGRAARAPRKLTLAPALGRPDLHPEQRLQVSGFKSEIDAAPWLIAEVTHTLNGNGGLTSTLSLEAA
jgi:phage protein D